MAIRLTFAGLRQYKLNIGKFLFPVFTSDTEFTIGVSDALNFNVGESFHFSTFAYVAKGDTTVLQMATAQNQTVATTSDNNNVICYNFSNTRGYYRFTENSIDVEISRADVGGNNGLTVMGVIVTPSGKNYYRAMGFAIYPTGEQPIKVELSSYAPTPTKLGMMYITITSADVGGGWWSPSNADLQRGEYLMGNSKPASDDPYDDAGESGTGGGGGSFDDSGDDIPIPNLPALSAANAGFITLFNPSVSQLNSLADYMWTNAAFDVANFKKIFEDPMDCILGLSIVPISVTTSGSADVAIGNMLISSIQFPVVSSQYQEFNCGSIPLTTPFFGGYLDYEPYTKIQIVVPYCGTFQISADDVIGKTINLVYHIDVLTGSCVAMLKCGNSVLYQFNGSCAVNIPINSINYASTIENATRIAVAIGTTVATAGAAAPAIMAGGEAAGAAQATLFNSAMNTAGATAEGALSMKPSIERSGALSSSSGMMSVQTPYIVITRPRLCLPWNQNKIKGYPSFITVTLGDLTGQGYTEFDSVILSGLFLTDEEKGELDNILRTGVYL